VQVRSRALRLDLGVNKAAQADAKSRKVGSEKFGIADEGEIGFQAIAVFADELRDGFTADFFFAFKDDADIQREFAVAALEEGLEGLDLHPELAFVVYGAAGVNVAVALGGLEGR
jgi:hypothetical protein